MHRCIYYARQNNRRKCHYTVGLDLHIMETLILNLDLLFNRHTAKIERLKILSSHHLPCAWEEDVSACMHVCARQRLIRCPHPLGILVSRLAWGIPRLQLPNPVITGRPPHSPGFFPVFRDLNSGAHVRQALSALSHLPHPLLPLHTRRCTRSAPALPPGCFSLLSFSLLTPLPPLCLCAVPASAVTG